MNVSPQTSVIIAAYNEEGGLPMVLGQLDRIINSAQIYSDGVKSDEIEVIVINDGSSDKTADAAAKYNCKVISHQGNMGKGQAMQTGIANSRGQNIIFIDADGTYPAEEIINIIEKLKDYDAVFTVREQKNIPLFNFIGNKIISAAIRIFSGFSGNDPLSGLYGIRRSVIGKINIESSDFSVETEIVVKTAVMGFKMTELPIKYERRLGKSKLSPFKDGLKIFRLICSLIIRYNPLITFVFPGIFLCLIGLVFFLLTASGDFYMADNIVFGIHTFIFSVMIFLVGFQIIIQGVILNLYAVKHGYKKPDIISKIFKPLFFKWLFILGLVILIAGVTMAVKSAFIWVTSGFQPYFETRQVIIALLFNFLGLQLIFSSLLGLVFVRETKNMDSDG